MGLRKGETLQGRRGRYKIDRLAGIGGLGRVWKAQDESGAVVAVKEPLSEGHADRVRVNFEKLRIEAVVLERLTGARPMVLESNKNTPGYLLEPDIQRHIVKFVDVDRADAPRSLVLEYLNGRLMADEFRSVAPSDFGFVEEYSTTILKIIKTLHEDNILHRDVSPRNLVRTHELAKDPVLIDFGTAKEGYNQISSSTHMWSQIVTPGYSAPELAMGLASPSSDLYSVAATILFMYTGADPQHLRNAAGQLDETRAPELQRIPRERFQVLKKAMSYHTSDRYQTADDMARALGGSQVEFAAPHIIASGRRFLIRSRIVIGRQHSQCGNDCKMKGFSTAPDIAINDPENYIGRHHLRLRPRENGECFLEDLHVASGTAIRHTYNDAFQKVEPGGECKLQDGDVIALAYSPTKGPYMTISYHSK